MNPDISTQPRTVRVSATDHATLCAYCLKTNVNPRHALSMAITTVAEHVRSEQPDCAFETTEQAVEFLTRNGVPWRTDTPHKHAQAMARNLTIDTVRVSEVPHGE